MEKFNDFYLELKPIVHTYIFELKKHKNFFIVFTVIVCLISFLISFMPIAFFPENSLDPSQSDYLQGGLGFISLIMIFGCCFFFSGIICSEFSTKTGYITFPKINKYKLIIGKYLGNLTLFIGVISIYYFVLGLLGLYYYGGPIIVRFFYSYGISILYILAVSSFVTFFSSFMKSVNITIITTILLFLIVFSLVEQIIVLISVDFEPIYSLNYISNLITEIMRINFPKTVEDRYTEFSIPRSGVSFRMWNTPSIEMGITVLLLYTVICFTLSSIIFKRKQL